MVTNLECVRPCYAHNASGHGAAAQRETWHDEGQTDMHAALQACAMAAAQTLELLQAAAANVSGEGGGIEEFVRASDRLLQAHRAAVDEQVRLVLGKPACAACVPRALLYQREAGAARLRALQAVTTAAPSGKPNIHLTSHGFLGLLEAEALHHLSTVTSQLRAEVERVASSDDARDSVLAPAA